MKPEYAEPMVEVLVCGFPGFYDTVLEAQCEMYDEQECEWYGFDYPDGMGEQWDTKYNWNEAGKACAEFLKCTFGLPLEFSELHTLKDYNYGNDSLYIKLPLTFLHQIFHEVPMEMMIKTTRKNFRDVSGWIPPYTDDYFEWGHPNNFDCGQWGTVLYCWMKQQYDGDFCEMWCWALENADMTAITGWKPLIEPIEGSDAWQAERYDPNQMLLDFGDE